MDARRVPTEVTDLPRLLYVGDVPVEASYHGSMLLFRLLQRYPVERLRIVEGNLLPAKTDRRLPGVAHATLKVGRTRLLNSRLHDWYVRWLTTTAPGRARQVSGLIDGFGPEAVLTVTHGYSWMTAARFAHERRLPLHLVSHDDWPGVVNARVRPRVEREFAGVYRQAVSRMCASPFMAEEYERRYGARGTVLFPYRSSDAPQFNGVADRLRVDRGRLVFAFAGTINTPGYARLLRHLAEALGDRGELLIFGPIDRAQAAAAGLDRPAVRLGGLLKSDELLHRLRTEADVLFAPMSFAPADLGNMRMGFPSKLTEYTSVGLPLLICGPADCSAVTWAMANPGVAEVAAAEDVPTLRDAVTRLANDRGHRIALAERAQAVGARDFSAATAETILHRALTGAA